MSLVAIAIHRHARLPGRVGNGSSNDAVEAAVQVRIEVHVQHATTRAGDSEMTMAVVSNVAPR